MISHINVSKTYTQKGYGQVEKRPRTQPTKLAATTVKALVLLLYDGRKFRDVTNRVIYVFIIVNKRSHDVVLMIRVIVVKYIRNTYSP